MITRHFQTKIMHRMVEHSGTIYFGGVTADDGSLDIKEQTQQICRKIDELLAQVGSSKENLLTATIFITDFSQKERMTEAWLEWLPAQHLPTRATIGVADLGEDCLVEVVLSAAKS
ncbi:RidA family protein [Sinorhizobium psoraleae]|uniref:RidA family protein n=1 Tax=Sinorhizobium psoraleae TaxID=520838 RepID=A0ABT4KQY9_9HYPH|nr:RidA family protein [Sinorhizobium psoraleae]MCZ4093706.1 RidA family protein [Sinorhizobium psoraleae]